MDAAALYQEEMFTDRKIGAIRRLTPVKSDGSVDDSRPVLFLGQAEIMTNMGPVPINFEIEGKTLAEAVAGFGAAAAVGIERTVPSTPTPLAPFQRMPASKWCIAGPQALKGAPMYRV
jgi:hypothetical protein